MYEERERQPLAANDSEPKQHGSMRDTGGAQARAREGAGPTERPVWIRIFGHSGLAPAALLVLGLILFVPGLIGVPPLGPDEPQFAQATKEMVEARDILSIRFKDAPRHEMPIGIHWLQALAVEASGLGPEAPIWVYRLPSTIGAIFAVLLTYWLARAFVGSAPALVAGALTAAAILLGVEARLATTDAVLLAALLAALGTLARAWTARTEERRPLLAALFWTALAAGVLVGGAVALLVVGLTVAGLCLFRRRLDWLKPLMPVAGLAWFVLLLLPWWVSIALSDDGRAFGEAVLGGFLGKVTAGRAGYGAPPLSHLAAVLATFWPIPAFLLLALPGIASAVRSDVVRFCLAWVVPSWIVFELMATKQPHDTLPLLPGLAILAAVALAETRRHGHLLRWTSAALLALPPLAIAAASIAVPVALGVWPSPPGAVLAAIAAFFALAAARRIVSDRGLSAVAPSLVAAVLSVFAVWGFSLPALDPIWVSARLAEAATEAGGCPDPQVASAGFDAPDYVFLQGTDTLLTTPEGAAAHLAAASPGACRVAVVERRDEDAFLAAASEAGAGVQLRLRVGGYSVENGGRLDIGIYVAEAAAGD